MPIRLSDIPKRLDSISNPVNPYAVGDPNDVELTAKKVYTLSVNQEIPLAETEKHYKRLDEIERKQRLAKEKFSGEINWLGESVMYDSPITEKIMPELGKAISRAAVSVPEQMNALIEWAGDFIEYGGASLDQFSTLGKDPGQVYNPLAETIMSVGRGVGDYGRANRAQWANLQQKSWMAIDPTLRKEYPALYFSSQVTEGVASAGLSVVAALVSGGSSAATTVGRLPKVTGAILKSKEYVNRGLLVLSSLSAAGGYEHAKAHSENFLWSSLHGIADGSIEYVMESKFLENIADKTPLIAGIKESFEEVFTNFAQTFRARLLENLKNGLSYYQSVKDAAKHALSTAPVSFAAGFIGGYGIKSGFDAIVKTEFEKPLEQAEKAPQTAQVEQTVQEPAPAPEMPATPATEAQMPVVEPAQSATIPPMAEEPAARKIAPQTTADAGRGWMDIPETRRTFIERTLADKVVAGNNPKAYSEKLKKRLAQITPEEQAAWESWKKRLVTSQKEVSPQIDDDIITAEKAANLTPEQRIDQNIREVIDPYDDNREIQDVRISDILSVAEDEISKIMRARPTGLSKKSEARYWENVGDVDVRLASHDVAYTESDKGVFIGVGSSIQDADVVLSENMTSAQIKEAIRKVLSSFNPPAAEQGSKTTVPQKPIVTSPRNEITNEERKAMGLGEVNSAMRKAKETSKANAIAQGIPQRALRISADIIENQRQITDEEEAGLTIRKMELLKERRTVERQILETTDKAQIKSLSAEANRIQDEFETITNALKIGGTEVARALAFRASEMDEDLNILSIPAKAKIAKGKALSDKEQANFSKLASDLEAANAKIEELQNQMMEQKAQKLIREGTVKRYRQMNKQELLADRDARIKKLKTLLEEGCYS
jgi:hypothetical protein